MIPNIIKVLMHFERHMNEGSWQTSFYVKITFFRWINTAIITKVFTPFTSNLDNDKMDALPSIYAILVSELLITPLIRVLDIGGNIKRHIVAPRAMTQQEMNLNFRGTRYRLGERFTVSTSFG